MSINTGTFGFASAPSMHIGVGTEVVQKERHDQATISNTSKDLFKEVLSYIYHEYNPSGFFHHGLEKKIYERLDQILTSESPEALVKFLEPKNRGIQATRDRQGYDGAEFPAFRYVLCHLICEMLKKHPEQISDFVKRSSTEFLTTCLSSIGEHNNWEESDKIIPFVSAIREKGCLPQTIAGLVKEARGSYSTRIAMPTYRITFKTEDLIEAMHLIQSTNHTHVFGSYAQDLVSGIFNGFTQKVLLSAARTSKKQERRDKVIGVVGDSLLSIAQSGVATPFHYHPFMEIIKDYEDGMPVLSDDYKKCIDAFEEIFRSKAQKEGEFKQAQELFIKDSTLPSTLSPDIVNSVLQGYVFSSREIEDLTPEKMYDAAFRGCLGAIDVCFAASAVDPERLVIWEKYLIEIANLFDEKTKQRCLASLEERVQKAKAEQ
jgi:hypothetical protein